MDSDAIEASTKGPIEIYGPSLFSLYAGGSAIFVRTTKNKGKASLTIKGESGETSIELEVK